MSTLAARPDARPATGRAVALAGVLVVTMIGTTLPTSLYATYEERLGFGVATVGVVFATYAVGVIAALLVTGRWSDALGRRPVLAGGLLVAVLSDVVFLLADSVPLLLVGRVLSGVSAGVFVGTASVFVVETARGALGGRASDLAAAANMGGLGLGPLVSAALVTWAPGPLHTSYVVHLGLAALGLLVVGLSAETSPRTRGASLAPLRPSLPPEVRPVFPRFAILAFASFMVFGLYTALVPTIASQVLDVTAPLAVAAIVAIAFGGSILSHQLTHHLAERPATVLAVGLLVVGMALLAVGLLAGATWCVVLAGLLGGSGQGIAFARGLRAVGQASPPEQRAAVTSTYFVVAYVAISLPVVAAGYAVAGWGVRPAGTGFAVVVAVLAAVAGALTVRQVPASRGM